MSVRRELSVDKTVLRLVVGESFDFSCHRGFRGAYEDLPLPAMRITVDLSATRNMDSSALGMLLVLRERAGGDAADITLLSPTETISQVLAVSRFEQLFKIDQGHGGI